MQLPDDVYQRITTLSKQGDTFFKEGRLDDARKSYIAAIVELEALPQDPRSWEASTWLFIAIGDVHFQLKNYDKAYKAFSNAVQCPQGLGNPFIHLRLGQIAYENGNMNKAADELTRAYMGAGIDIFMEDDPKYLAFLETKIIM